MAQTAEQHRESLVQARSQAGEALAEAQFQHDDAIARIDQDEAETLRLAERYDDLRVESRHTRNLYSSSQVNGVVTGYEKREFDDGFNMSDVVAYFYVQDGDSKVFSSPFEFSVAFRSRDERSDDTTLTITDEWQQQARDAGIPEGLISQLQEELEQEQAE